MELIFPGKDPVLSPEAETGEAGAAPPPLCSDHIKDDLAESVAVSPQPSLYELDGGNDSQDSRPDDGKRNGAYFSRIPDIIYGEVHKSELDEQIHLSPIKKAQSGYSPPLHPRTTSMLHSTIPPNIEECPLSLSLGSLPLLSMPDSTGSSLPIKQPSLEPSLSPSVLHPHTDSTLDVTSHGSSNKLGLPSTEDNYDDIVIHKIPKSSLTKPALLPKPKYLPGPVSWYKHSTVAEDIYDDIIVHRIQNRKPKIPPKPFHIQLLLSHEAPVSSSRKMMSSGAVDGMAHRPKSDSKPKLLPKPIQLLGRKISDQKGITTEKGSDWVLRKNGGTVLHDSLAKTKSLGTSGFDDDNDDNVYDDTVIAVLRKQSFSTSTSLEDIYDDIIVHRLRNDTPSKPKVPNKPRNIHSHPRVLKMQHLKKLKQLQAIEEIYDLPSTTDFSDLAEVDDIYIDPTTIYDSEDSDIENHHKVKDVATGSVTGGETIGSPNLTEGKNGLDHSQNKTNCSSESAKIPSGDKGSEDETYEELVIYEELSLNRDAGYQNIEEATAEALGLPKDIRKRTVRISKGPQRRKFRDSMKRRSLSLAEKDDSCTFEDLVSSKSNNSLVENDALDKKPDTTAPNSSEADENYDGYMSHTKGRQVLDMLLEVNNVKMAAHRDGTRALSHSQSVQSTNEESDVDFDITLPPEIEEYQKVGIIPKRTQSEIASEIRQLTDSAPKEPPPLPGIQRARVRAVTRSDNLIHKRKQLVKTNTFPLHSK